MAELQEVAPAATLDDSVEESNPDATVLPHRRTSLRQPQPIDMSPHSHRIPGTQYFALAVWIGLLLLLYAWARVVCLFGVPHDCTSGSDIAAVWHDIEYLLYAGVVLAILTGLHWPDRFQYVFCFSRRSPRGYLFLAVTFLSVLVWGSLDLVPALTHFSLKGGMSGLYQIMVFLILGGAVLLVSWHIWTAWKYNSWSGFAAYAVSRLGIVAFYGAHLLVIPPDGSVSFHFHHYVIAYIAASLAEFNHPLSLLLLGIGTGVFVQGISAYDADPVISDNQGRVICLYGSRGILSPPLSVQGIDFLLKHFPCWEEDSSLRVV